MPYIREIIQLGHPTLRKVAKKVHLEELNDPLMQQLFDDMFETMYDAPGIGLAAPQIGISKRIFTIDLQDDKDEHGPFVVVNPKFELTEGAEWRKDGCLSYDGYVGETERYTHVIVSGFDRNGEKIRLDGTGLFAHCLQHEIDHLNGVLYLDKARNVHLPTDDEDDDSDEGGAAVDATEATVASE